MTNLQTHKPRYLLYYLLFQLIIYHYFSCLSFINLQILLFQEKKDLDILYKILIEAKKDADKSKEEAHAELLKCKKLEAEAAEAINRVGLHLILFL